MLIVFTSTSLIKFIKEVLSVKKVLFKKVAGSGKLGKMAKVGTYKLP